MFRPYNQWDKTCVDVSYSSSCAIHSSTFFEVTLSVSICFSSLVFSFHRVNDKTNHNTLSAKTQRKHLSTSPLSFVHISNRCYALIGDKRKHTNNKNISSFVFWCVCVFPLPLNDSNTALTRLKPRLWWSKTERDERRENTAEELQVKL